jgi:1-phosphatidylinositol-4-phosphate 5-kinase
LPHLRCCCCRDERFLLKSVTRDEARKLLLLLPSYTQHMARYPSSLLLRFYGLHRVACIGGRRVSVVEH